MDTFNNQNGQNYGYNPNQGMNPNQNQGNNYGYNQQPQAQPQPRPNRPTVSQPQNYGYTPNQSMNQNQGQQSYGYNSNQIPTQKQNQQNGYVQSQGYNNGQVMPKTGWSWGAAAFTLLWGLGNYTWMPFISLIPFLNLFWWIVCGIKGHEWAMKSRRFRNVEEFNAVQESWDRAGKIAFFVLIAVYVLVFAILLLGGSLGLLAAALSGGGGYR